MSKKSSVRLSAVLLFVAFVTAAIFVEDFGVLAQNANSSTGEEPSMQSTNANRARRQRRRQRRRNRRRAMRANTSDMAAPDANLASDANVSADANASSGGQDTTNTGGGEDADLSGTYTGRVTVSGGHEMSAQGTLTITGNTFTLEAEGMTHSGRIRAVTTRGYTGASLWFTDITDAASNTPLVATVRARKTGDRLTLSPVPGARNRLTFASGGSGGGGRRRPPRPR